MKFTELENKTLICIDPFVVLKKETDTIEINGTVTIKDLKEIIKRKEKQLQLHGLNLLHLISCLQFKEVI
jgi:hypothetical protein